MLIQGFFIGASVRPGLRGCKQLPWNGVSALQFPQGDPGKLADSENNIIVWLGEGKYPGEVQLGFKVVTDRSVWDNAKAKWIADHPKVARFPFDPPGAEAPFRKSPKRENGIKQASTSETVRIGERPQCRVSARFFVTGSGDPFLLFALSFPFHDPIGCLRRTYPVVSSDRLQVSVSLPQIRIAS